jgi:L-seryl-tRNA(Ser) seleniumtransferase
VPQGDQELLLRSLPSVDDLLQSAVGSAWAARVPRERVVSLARGALAEVRAEILSGSARNGFDGTAEVVARVAARLDRLTQPSLRRVINASGVILHTNLGRAPLAKSAIAAIADAASGYSNLEYDLAQGRRGKRDVHAAELLEELLGAPAIVVNNNAAAIFLVLNELSRDGETIVSRGELIEIGDGFRIPQILERSGAILREVGTTNRTRIDDYREAIRDQTRVLLRVHPSNFRQVGFTSRPSLAELAALAKESSLPLVEDLGSGCLSDLRSIGVEDELPVTNSIEAGVDVVTFSGDKLLGGPQAGIITGKPELIQRIRRNPLFRALRVDKLTYAALGATLREFIVGNEAGVPALRMMRLSADELRGRAERFVKELGLPGVSIENGESLLGGGSTPAQSLPSPVIVIEPGAGASAQRMERRLRGGDPPVIARIEHDRLILDLRTVDESDDGVLIQAVKAV